MAPEQPPLDSQSSDNKRVRKVPAYFLSIVVLFVLPVIGLLKVVWKKIPLRSFLISILIISVIGWIWSWTVSSHRWWTFGSRFMLGIQVIPDLPLEEFLFYPLGGAFSILVYIYSFRFKTWISAGFYWFYLLAGTLGFGVLAWMTRANSPCYLYSQLVVYNLLCGLLLAPWVARQMNLVGALMPVLVLGVVGYGWDYVAFTYGWWNYHAITQVRIGIVPIDDFNFFLYAPPSAVAIYHVVCRGLKEPILKE